MSKFWGWRACAALMVSGGMVRVATPGARLRTCYEHPAHLMRFVSQTVVPLLPEGVKTMTATTSASRSAAPTQASPAIPAHNLTAVLAAFNAANLASSYIERGNFAAAKRKLVQALASVNQLQTEG